MALRAFFRSRAGKETCRRRDLLWEGGDSALQPVPPETRAATCDRRRKVMRVGLSLDLVRAGSDPAATWLRFMVSAAWSPLFVLVSALEPVRFLVVVILATVTPKRCSLVVSRPRPGLTTKFAPVWMAEPFNDAHWGHW
jgi:hypothetical protein